MSISLILNHSSLLIGNMLISLCVFKGCQRELGCLPLFQPPSSQI